jgi:hypothetical protein
MAIEAAGRDAAVPGAVRRSEAGSEAATAERRRPGHPPVREWRVHIGAHKTATTHLQDTLEAIRPILAQRGLDAIDHRAFRRAGQKFVSLRNWRVWAGGRFLRQAFLACLEPLRAGPDRLILSEENFLGFPRSAVAERPYRSAPLRLRALAAVGATAPLHLFLTIRRMDSFLPSAYAQVLRDHPPKARLAGLTRRWSEAPPRWTDIVRRIRQAVPGAALTVWRYEDYPAHRGEILDALCGTPIDALPDIPRPEATMRPSAAAILAAEALDPAMPLGDWRRRVEALYREAPAGRDNPPYAPFGEADCARFAAAYEADCAALAAEGVLLRFRRAPGDAADRRG